jgi:hypothetical protein
LGTEKPGAAGLSPGVPGSLPPDSGWLHVAPMRLSAPSVQCAEIAARRLGGRFEYSREARRVCIYWPLA